MSCVPFYNIVHVCQRIINHDATRLFDLYFFALDLSKMSLQANNFYIINKHCTDQAFLLVMIYDINATIQEVKWCTKCFWLGTIEQYNYRVKLCIHNQELGFYHCNMFQHYENCHLLLKHWQIFYCYQIHWIQIQLDYFHEQN